MNKTKNFTPSFNKDMLNTEDNKQFFHQLNHLSVLIEIKDQSFSLVYRLCHCQTMTDLG